MSQAALHTDRAEKKATLAIALPDADAEIEPVSISAGGRKPEPGPDWTGYPTS